MIRLSDVVRHLLIINVIAFLGSKLFFDVRIAAIFYPLSPYFQPFQIVTHMFMHGGFEHLLFNMLGLVIFGPALEYSLGPKKFLFYYFFAGFGALLLHLFVMYMELNYLGAPLNYVNTPMLGASGAIMGVLVGYAMKFPQQVLHLIFPPIRVKAIYLVLILITIDIWSGFGRSDGIAHFAHLGGALFGFLLIEYWSKFRPR